MANEGAVNTGKSVIEVKSVTEDRSASEGRSGQNEELGKKEVEGVEREAVGVVVEKEEGIMKEDVVRIRYWHFKFKKEPIYVPTFGVRLPLSRTGCID